MAENQFFVDSSRLGEEALKVKHRLEQDPSSRSNHMEYMLGMEQIQSDIMEKVLYEMGHYDYNAYTEEDVRRALDSARCSIEDFKAFWSRWQPRRKSKPESISATRYIFSRRCILPTIAKTTAFTAVLTATMTSSAKS